MKEKIKVKQDINYTHCPTWFQDIYESQKGLVWTDIDGYKFRAGYKVPTRKDWLILLYIMHLSQEEGWVQKVKVSRYKVLKKCKLSTSSKDYKRLEEALEKWINVVLSYNGIFYDGNNYKRVQFNIINDWGFNKKTKLLEVDFNEKWLLKAQNSKYDFDEMVEFKSPLVTRLNELLNIQFYERDEWSIDAVKFAKKIPIKQKYPSEIIKKLNPALKKVREGSLKVYVHPIKQKKRKTLLVFTKDRKYEESASGQTNKDKKFLAKWEVIRNEVKEEIGTGAFDRYIYPLTLDYTRSNKNKLTLLAPNPNFKKNIMSHFWFEIQDAAGDVEIALEVMP
ncbi:MAG: hypothetical protein GY718_02495 [Lentisphaerae bacterium]|nr:hypothetical protein [Lentisphaerota bacterium]